MALGSVCSESSVFLLFSETYTERDFEVNLYRVLSNLKRRFYDLRFASQRPLVDSESGRNLSGFEEVCEEYLSGIHERKSTLPSISFVYRIKDAELYIELSVLTVLPLASEIIFVDNGSKDDTLRIVHRLMSDYGHVCKFKLERYDETVHRQGPSYQTALRQLPQGSLAKFYNHCFSMADSDYVFKMDAHKYLLPFIYEDVQKRIAKGDPIVFMRGHDFSGRTISYEPLLYRNSPDIMYKDGQYYEYLDYSCLNLSVSDLYRSRIDCKGFLHLKSLAYSSVLSKL